MKKLFLLLMAVALVASGCSWWPLGPKPVAKIDWVDFLKLKGITYNSMPTQHGRAPAQSDLGDVYDQVRFMVAGNVTDPGYKTKDGDAAFLAAGTKVYKVKGYDPRFRLAAVRDGQYVFYEVDQNPNAKTGADLLDLEGKVSHVVIRSTVDFSPIAEIRDPAVVKAMVSDVLTAALFPDSGRGGMLASENRIGVTFVFNDGTATTRGYWFDSGFFMAGSGLKLPDSFGQAIKAALK